MSRALPFRILLKKNNDNSSSSDKQIPSVKETIGAETKQNDNSTCEVEEQIKSESVEKKTKKGKENEKKGKSGKEYDDEKNEKRKEEDKNITKPKSKYADMLGQTLKKLDREHHIQFLTHLRSVINQKTTQRIEEEKAKKAKEKKAKKALTSPKKKPTVTPEKSSTKKKKGKNKE